MKDEDFAFHIGALVGFSIGFFQVFSLASPFSGWLGAAYADAFYSH